MKAKGQAEWDAASVGPAVVGAGRVAAVDIPGGGGGGRGGGQRHPEETHVDGKKILERISKETGGRFFEITKKEDRSARSTTALPRNCASSTTWVLRPIRTARPPAIITFS
jgi:hypothetical protein